MTAFLVLLLPICGILFFCASMIDAFRSPEFKRDLERLRAQRRARQASRRS